MISGHPAPSASDAAAATGGLAQLMLKEQKYSDAEPLLKSALGRDPRDPVLNAQWPPPCWPRGKMTRRCRCSRPCRQLEPNNGAVDHMLADAYSQSGIQTRQTRFTPGWSRTTLVMRKFSLRKGKPGP